MLKHCAVGAVADEDGVLAFEMREGGEIGVGDLASDAVLVGGVDEGHAAAFEAGTREAATIDAGGLGHDLVEADLFGGT